MLNKLLSSEFCIQQHYYGICIQVRFNEIKLNNYSWKNCIRFALNKCSLPNITCKDMSSCQYMKILSFSQLIQKLKVKYW